jgi:hypothetical protein
MSTPEVKVGKSGGTLAQQFTAYFGDGHEPFGRCAARAQFELSLRAGNKSFPKTIKSYTKSWMRLKV